MKKGRLLEIIKEVTNDNSLPYAIDTSSIWQRFKRNKLMIIARPSQISPLLPIEPNSVSVIIKLDCIWQCSSPTLGLLLINSKIQCTTVREDLIWNKQRVSTTGDIETLGKASKGYWRNFKVRNRDKIVSKKVKSTRWIELTGALVQTSIRWIMESIINWQMLEQRWRDSC